MLAHLVIWALCYAATSIAVVRAAKQCPSGSPTVTSNGVTYIGGRNSLCQAYYKGIPFATAPTKALRFAPPQPISIKVGTTRSAIQSSMLCHTFDDQQTGQSEDCLYLDMLTPASIKTGDALPVIVFIPGGAFRNTANHIDGSSLLAQGDLKGTRAIYITMNYRLMAYGWLVGKEAQAAGYTNVGLLDQRAALEWVQANIAAFGGDPTKVLLVGQSAGAISVAAHLLRDGGNTHGLFRAAFMISGQASTLGIGPAATRQYLFNALVKKAGCTGKANLFSCLEAVSEKQFHRICYTIVKTATYTFGPQIDGSIIPGDPATLLASGNYANIPIIVGDVLDETTAKTAINTSAEVISFVNSFAPQGGYSGLQQLVPLYSSKPQDGSPYNTGTQLYGLGSLGKQAGSVNADIQFHAPRRWISQQATARGQAVYSYLFTQPSGKSTGVYHGSDLGSWFGGSGSLGSQMTSYYLNFANTLNPNGNGLKNWPQYGSSASMLQLMSSNVTTITDNYRASQISYINNNPASFLH